MYSGGNAIWIGINGIDTLANICNKELWLVSSTGVVSVEITNGKGTINQDVVLEIIFRDNPA